VHGFTSLHTLPSPLKPALQEQLLVKGIEVFTVEQLAFKEHEPQSTVHGSMASQPAAEELPSMAALPLPV
jgi:hypothetical protein